MRRAKGWNWVLALLMSFGLGCERDNVAGPESTELPAGGGAPFAGTPIEGDAEITSGTEGSEGEEGSVVACGVLGSACDDEEDCTVNDTCEEDGICRGEAILCEDGVVCTDDFCSGGTCVHALLEGYCLIEGNCYSDGQSNPEGGCSLCDAEGQPEAWAVGGSDDCDDNDPCTLNDTCSGGGCTGTLIPCSDNDPCTLDGCENGVCVFTLDPDCGTGECTEDGDCEDGDVCTLNFCANGECLSAPIDGCGQGGQDCVVDGDCLTASGCEKGLCEGGYCDFSTLTPLNGALCTDGDPCTIGDMCSNGVCAPGSNLLDGDMDGHSAKECGGLDCNDGSSAAAPGLVEVCGDGLDNDCNNFIDDADAACSAPTGPVECTHHANCEEDELCGYWPTFGNERCSALCASTLDCEADLICAHVPGSANVGYCRPSYIPSGGATGTGCAEGAECMSEICSGGLCATLCADEDACGGQNTCFPAGDLQTGFNGICSPDSTFPGGIQTGQSCGVAGSGACLSGHCDLLSGTTPCASVCGTDGDCSFSQECGLILRSNVPIEDSMPYDPLGFADPTYDGMLGCFTRPGLASAPVGTVCTIPDQCRSNKCLPLKQSAGDPTGYCTAFCTKDSDCPGTMACLPGVVTLTSNWLAADGSALETSGTVARICKFPL
jgi:hypothetical protein